jgi:hypothetical protein
MNFKQIRTLNELAEKYPELEKLVKELDSRLKKLETKRKPGRPRKNEAK